MSGRASRAAGKAVVLVAVAVALTGVTTAYADTTLPSSHSEGYAPDVWPDAPAAVVTPAPPVVGPEHTELAYSGTDLTPWWITYGVIGIAVGAVLLHLIRPSKGDE